MAKLKECSFCKKPSLLWHSIPACCFNWKCKLSYNEAKKEKELDADETPISKPKKNYKINIVSEKRKTELAEYRKERKSYLSLHPICQVCNISETTEIHHKKGKIGKLLYNPLYFLAVCRPCHNKIENNPEWSKENGYSLNRL